MGVGVSVAVGGGVCVALGSGVSVGVGVGVVVGNGVGVNVAIGVAVGVGVGANAARTAPPNSRASSTIKPSNGSSDQRLRNIHELYKQIVSYPPARWQ
mgnify:CR=1 FL=1